MAEQAPSSSPRLPSPPPIAEDQISPAALSGDDHGKLEGQLSLLNDQAAMRRIRPGSRAEDMHSGPPLVQLSDIDSAFQLTEHLRALHNSYTHPDDAPDSEVPIDRETARALAAPPPGVDKGIWLYELCRFLTQKANAMVIGLFSDEPACSATTCPEMRASEWQYLCAAHEPPKSCCAIDYCCHTLDWCATSLTSTKLFPSRLSLGTESASAQMQVRKMTEVFRRVYRIFAHAWFSHRDAFWRVETKTGLYLFFKLVCDEYSLIQEDNYTIPPEAEGIDTTPVAAQDLTELPTLMRRDTVRPTPAEDTPSNTTKRHKHTMSAIPDRSVSLSTIIHEEVEEDEDEPVMSPEHEADRTGTVELLVDDEGLDAAHADDESEHSDITEIHDDMSELLGEHPPTYDDSEDPARDTTEGSAEKSELESGDLPHEHTQGGSSSQEKADEKEEEPTTSHGAEKDNESPEATTIEPLVSEAANSPEEEDPPEPEPEPVESTTAKTIAESEPESSSTTTALSEEAEPEIEKSTTTSASSDQQTAEEEKTLSKASPEEHDEAKGTETEDSSKASERDHDTKEEEETAKVADEEAEAPKKDPTSTVAT
ncbi:hypothetical protein AAFC00_002452 [Neodothiora populina]|uniref:Mob1/phocein n=1 Tax=Neodothiora populina TaxID=2781224 RepID=A0ABR3P7K2_9PEZI